MIEIVNDIQRPSAAEKKVLCRFGFCELLEKQTLAVMKSDPRLMTVLM